MKIWNNLNLETSFKCLHLICMCGPKLSLFRSSLKFVSKSVNWKFDFVFWIVRCADCGEKKKKKKRKRLDYWKCLTAADKGPLSGCWGAFVHNAWSSSTDLVFPIWSSPFKPTQVRNPQVALELKKHPHLRLHLLMDIIQMTESSMTAATLILRRDWFSCYLQRSESFLVWSDSSRKLSNTNTRVDSHRFLKRFTEASFMKNLWAANCDRENITVMQQTSTQHSSHRACTHTHTHTEWILIGCQAAEFSPSICIQAARRPTQKLWPYTKGTDSTPSNTHTHIYAHTYTQTTHTILDVAACKRQRWHL